MSSPYPVLGDRPIDQWKVTELKDELKRRKLMTKGLKEDLVKRLDEAIRNEGEGPSKDNGFGSVLKSEAASVQEKAEVYISENAQNTLDVRDSVTEEINVDLHPQVTYEQESSNLFVTERAKDAVNHGDSINEKVNRNILNVDINDNQGLKEQEQIRDREGVDCSDSAGQEEKQVTQVTAEETIELVSENLEPVRALNGEDLQDTATQKESSDVKAQPDNDDSKSLHVDAEYGSSDKNNQVSEVNPALGFQVKCESISTETVSIIEKNELKDNIIADDVKLELDVKSQMVQPSTSSDVPEGGKPHPMDVEEPQANMVSMEETGGSNADSVDVVPKKDTGNLSSSGKVNFDRSIVDDFMEKDVTKKQIGSKTDSDEMRTDAGKVEASALKDEGLVHIVDEDISAEKKVSDSEEKNGGAAPSAKRKLNDQVAVGNTDIAKRQRRWNSDGLKVSEARTGDVVSTTPKNGSTPKNVFDPAFKRSFSRSDSTVSEEMPKERVVPPSAKPPTNSLRIDRFLRPFTLKAVRELLGKTGTITDFWMDHIKTHCYVSYSSTEEAAETRNAVYNLQWPTNGGRLLLAEFVDPQEVKARLELPQSLATPVSSGASILPVTQNMQPQPSPRPQVPKQQLPQPPLALHPPTLSNPPPVRDQLPPPLREHLPPVRERLTLPPPPPLPEKAEPPIVTLDDLFRKTKATPRIYYLPLSDEQVAAKVQAQGKTVKQ